MRTHRYGPAPEQEGDLYLPARPHPPVVCLLHGGFWRQVYRRDQFIPVAEDLAARGFAVWNLEYRRLGAPGGGWPGTLQDVAAGIDRLADLPEHLDLTRVITAGHSAGGHLALWAPGRPARVRVTAAAGLAPVADLVEAHRLHLGRGVVHDFLGGSPEEHPDRYRDASPRALLPRRIPQLILHGTDDDTVPISIARDYAQAARAAGDHITFTELPARGHFDFLDPTTEAHTLLCTWLQRWS